jgi:CRP/FNR family transcriptional regulator, nitrogen oxide reductase regulator
VAVGLLPSARYESSEEPLLNCLTHALQFGACEAEELIVAARLSPFLALAIADRDLRIVAVNGAFAALNGIPSHGHLGKTFGEVAGGFADHIETALRRVFSTGLSLCHKWVGPRSATKNDSGDWSEVYFPIRDTTGDVKQAAVLLVEISDKLKESSVSDWAWDSLPDAQDSSLSSHGFAAQPDQSVKSSSGPPSYKQLRTLSAKLFGQLDDATVDSLFRSGVRQYRRRGEAFCRQGEPDTNLYLITNGLVKLSGMSPSGREVLLDWMHPGEVFGLGAFLSSPAKHIWSIFSARDTEVLVWTRTTVKRFLLQAPSFYQNALAIAMGWACQLEERLEEISGEMVEPRIAYLMLFLARRMSDKLGATELFVSDEELAQMAGTTSFTVNRILNRWQRHGYIEKHRKRLLIKDKHSLERISVNSRVQARMASAHQATE